jgi:circadian clock protein KaiC
MKRMDEQGRMAPLELPKSPAGIQGLDEVARGGPPGGRTTLIIGKAGSGKTLFGMELSVHGAPEYGESSIFASVEEKPERARKARAAAAPALIQPLRNLIGFRKKE